MSESRARYYCLKCAKGKGTSFAVDTFRCFRALAALAEPPRYCDDCGSAFELRVSSTYETVVLDAFVPRGTRWDDRKREPTLYPFLVFSQPAEAGGGRRLYRVLRCRAGRPGYIPRAARTGDTERLRLAPVGHD
jgi:hypothetical protein